MATAEEKELMVETLKFTPQKYIISCYGYGGEVVMGRVTEEAYNYFIENNIDLETYAYDWDNEQNVPDSMQPFVPGEWHDCDDIAHETGIEMNNGCYIEVSDREGNTVWKSSLDFDELDQHGSEVIETGEVYASDQSPGTIVFYGQSFEKGTFFEQEFDVNEPFDPKKLRLQYEDVEGWPLMSGIEYKGQFLEDGYDSYDTVGKSSTFMFMPPIPKEE